MKVLFLDIDGVLNSHAFLMRTKAERLGVDWDPKLDERWIAMLDPDAIARLDRVVRETGAVVVISSTWRQMLSPAEIGSMLASKGFTGDVIGATTTSYGLRPDKKTERGDQIAHWINGSREVVESFVILDDDRDMSDLAHRHVHTRFATGFTDEDAEKAIAMLNEVTT